MRPLAFVALLVLALRAEATIQRGDLVVMSAYVGSIGGFFFDEVEAYRGGKLVQRLETRTGGLDSGLLCDREGIFIAADGMILRFDADGERAVFATIDARPTSLVRDVAGNMYFSGYDANGAVLMKLDPSGRFVRQYLSPRSSSTIDLAADQCTLLLRAPNSRAIQRIDVCTGAPLPDIVPQVPTGSGGDVRILPDNSILIASYDAVYRISASGTVLHRFSVPGSTNWTALAVDPDATTFWAGALEYYWGTGIAHRFELESGNPIGEPVRFLGVGIQSLGVIGEYRAASGASEIPTFSTAVVLLLATALAVVAVVRL
jgi:hypothetical protein